MNPEFHSKSIILEKIYWINKEVGENPKVYTKMEKEEPNWNSQQDKTNLKGYIHIKKHTRTIRV